MSSFLKRGQRAQVRAKNKEVKQRTKEFYKILGEMDEVATQMVNSDIIITEENVVEEAAKYTDREIGQIEKFLLLGKTHQYYEYMKSKQDGKGD